MTTKLVATLFHTSRRVPSDPSAQQNGTNTTARGFINAETLHAFTKLVESSLPSPALSSRILDSPAQPRVVEVSIVTQQQPQQPQASASPSSPLDLAVLRRHEPVLSFERLYNVEIVFQRDGVFRRHKRLAVFDMDSTLIRQEVIDEIARKLGVEAQVSAITERAMNGELDFSASLRERCALLRGVPATVFVELRSVITLSEGVAELIRALKRLGYKTAVLSGGFTPLTGWLAEQLGLDHAFANHLAVSDDGASLTGEVLGQIVHAEQKRVHALEIAEKEGILLEQTLCVGDGANDLPMMRVAGLGVAFNAKPKVQLEAPARLNTKSMLDVLYLLGFTREEQEELIR